MVSFLGPAHPLSVEIMPFPFLLMMYLAVGVSPPFLGVTRKARISQAKQNPKISKIAENFTSGTMGKGQMGDYFAGECREAFRR